MPAPRFFCPVHPTVGTTFELPTALAHHATRVLRLKHNTPIVLFNGQQGQYNATLLLEGKKAIAHVHEFDPRNLELPGQLTLAQALVSAEKMDWIIEKAVESGVHTLVPIMAQRSVANFSAERLAKKMQHWERVIESASAQCGRNQLMQLTKPQTLANLLENSIAPAKEEPAITSTSPETNAKEAGAELTLVCHPTAQHTLRDVLGPSRSRITLLIGPEGGWSTEELAQAEKAGAEFVRFGKRVLRTETAGLAMVSAISALQNWE
ncbi:MAG: 16S rRNA (uracil(1498)-N(3))-methyltransferase [Pusillimonas sp.]|nr:16S rRNA (uracil(1498)-N(3))-methyltransferase [Pusillimonas sp.]